VKKHIAKALILTLVLVLCAGASGEAAEKKILRYGAVNQKSTLDMQLNTYSRVMDISDMNRRTAAPHRRGEQNTAWPRKT
jgi:hypothetical protein